ncbi:MAG: ATP-binding protein [Atopobiaceae bacterium]|nr:ATP-binding protein [Atopobiaceae bacterium]
MECPLCDSRGNHRSLRTIEFKDFDQLKDMDEGYAVEYKSALDKHVKNKLPKIITSFANASGGWIFIGVEDKGTVTCIEAPRTDYGQTIGQIVHRHITPLPQFDCRFISDPDDTDHGVLVIEVQEGITPPYIANGCVYVRVGSSTDEFTEKADSYVLIDLHRKARAFKDELEEFNHRTVYFPPRTIKQDGTFLYTFPLFDVYMKRLYGPKGKSIPFEEFDKAVETMTEAFESVFKDKCFCQHAHHSLLFRRVINNCVDDAAPIIELFYDGSMKLCVPISMQQETEHDRALEHLSSLRLIRNTGLVRIIDGFTSVGLVMQSCQVLDAYLKLKGRSAGDYAIATEFENMQGMMVEFRTQEFDAYVREYGIPFVGTLDEKSHSVLPRKDADETPLTVSDLVSMSFYESFGLPMATANEEARRATMHVLLGDLADRNWSDDEP